MQSKQEQNKLNKSIQDAIDYWERQAASGKLTEDEIKKRLDDDIWDINCGYEIFRV